MSERVLFVDLENVQSVDLTRLPSDAQVLIFYGVTQKRLPEHLVVNAQPLGSRLRWIKSAGQGRNALDFHLAFYLGEQFKGNPDSECVILTRDTGFDPLIRHVRALGRACRRVASLNDAFAAKADPFTRLVSLLSKDKSRPTKLKALAGKLKSWFPNLTEEERTGLVQRLFTEARVSESEAGKVLTYNLG